MTPREAANKIMDSLLAHADLDSSVTVLERNKETVRDRIEAIVRAVVEGERLRILRGLSDHDLWPTDGCEDEVRPRIETLVRGSRQERKEAEHDQ